MYIIICVTYYETFTVLLTLVVMSLLPYIRLMITCFQYEPSKSVFPKLVNIEPLVFVFIYVGIYKVYLPSR